MRSREFIWIKYKVPLTFYKKLKAKGNTFRKPEKRRVKWKRL